MTEFAIYGGVDNRGTVGRVAPGLFAQEGRCWRMIYENPVGQERALHGAGGVGWPVEVIEGLDEGMVVRTSRRRSCRGPRGGSSVVAWYTSVSTLSATLIRCRE